MFYVSLILSGLLLLVTCLAVRFSREPGPVVLGTAVAVVICPGMLMLIFPAVALQALLIGVAFVGWRLLGRRRRVFVCLAFTATVAAHAIVAWFTYRDLARLREQFPYVSMAERLPARNAPAAPLAAATSKQLDRFEELIEAAGTEGWEKQRLDGLRQLHEEAVETFLNQQGFGYARMPRTVSEWVLKAGLREEPPVPQPAPRSTDPWTDRALQAAPGKSEPKPDPEWLGMHLKGAADFVHPKGFGYFKDRRHVAGFQPHQFSKPPEPPQRWALKTLDLVGLVVHDEPVAYISANLPRMDELRKAPTRPLDAFEAAGLAALSRGDDLFVRDTADGRRRMLGAVRSVTQCLSCHGGERGELLGAFSYTLAPERP